MACYQREGRQAGSFAHGNNHFAFEVERKMADAAFRARRAACVCCSQYTAAAAAAAPSGRRKTAIHPSVFIRRPSIHPAHTNCTQSTHTDTRSPTVHLFPSNRATHSHRRTSCNRKEFHRAPHRHPTHRSNGIGWRTHTNVHARTLYTHSKLGVCSFCALKGAHTPFSA